MTQSALLRAPDASAAPDERIDAFLRANSRAYLFVATRTGEVRGWPLTATYQPGLLYFTTYRKSVKTPHLAVARDAAVVVATPEGRQPTRYASISGAVRVLDFTPEVVDRFIQLQPDTETRVDDEVKARFRQRLAEGKRVLIEVDVREASLHYLDEPIGGIA